MILLGVLAVFAVVVSAMTFIAYPPTQEEIIQWIEELFG